MTTDYKLTAKEREELRAAAAGLLVVEAMRARFVMLGKSREQADDEVAAGEMSAFEVLFSMVEGIILDHLIAEREMMGKT